jgi:GNAT superfamily N-acetyltransferase
MLGPRKILDGDRPVRHRLEFLMRLAHVTMVRGDRQAPGASRAWPTAVLTSAPHRDLYGHPLGGDQDGRHPDWAFLRSPEAGGMLTGVRWRIRPFAAAADWEFVERLWRAAMSRSWPLLPAGIALLGEGLVAEAGTGPVGLVAVDRAGSVPLILVDPAFQRRGIGTGLLAAALEQLRAAGVTSVTAASGGGAYIWPGVPRDLPAAVRFFATRGWRHTHDTLDLVTDLARYRPPPGARERAASVGVTITGASSADVASVLAFEATTFPSWARWFSAASPGDILAARDGSGNIAGTLLFQGPGADTVFAPMLGPAAGTIGCVGVASPMQGHGIGTGMVARASQILQQAGTRNCHIGWTTRESFYRRAGYRPWRRYAMFTRPA